MNFLERIPTAWLLAGAGLACLVLWAAPGWAPSAGASGETARLGDARITDPGEAARVMPVSTSDPHATSHVTPAHEREKKPATP